MNYLKQLAGQSVIYGMGTIVPRLLNFVVLTPFYTRIFGKSEYGIITELYAYMVLLLIVLTFGLETGFFRFYKNSKDKNVLFSTLSLALLFINSLFILIVQLNLQDISSALGYADHPEYIRWFSFIVAIDAFISIPFARLRADNKPRIFALIKLVNVFSILLLSFFILYLGKSTHLPYFNQFYKQEIGVGYVFIINLVGSIISFFFLLPQFKYLKFHVDLIVLKKVLAYSFPILLAGLAGAVNEAIDRILLKHLIDNKDDAMAILGVYGANYKLAVFMTLFIQMFKYAAEPFFFDHAKNKDAKIIYADVMNYFVIFGLIIYLFVVLYIDVFKYFIGSIFHEGLHIVPIVLLANLFLGIFYNLSVWYKINDLTRFGALITFVGAFITLTLNFLLIPVMGYTGCAVAHLVCYIVMVLLSFVLGRKYYPVPYNIKKIIAYILLSVGMVVVSSLIEVNSMALKLAIHTIMFLSFTIFIVLRERVIQIFLGKNSNGS